MNGFFAQRPSHPRNPWWVVVGSGLAMAVSAGPLIMSTLGLFVIPITEETGWSRATVTAAFTFLALGQAIGTPLVGHFLDRFAFRSIVVPSWLLYCLSLALVTVVPRTLPLFYVPYFFAGLFASGTIIPFTKAILSWFDNKRGTAVGVTAALAALGSTVGPLLATFLLGAYGWQGAYRWLALIALVVSMTMVFVLVRVRAERSVRGRLVKEATENNRTVNLEPPGLTVRESLRGVEFWIIAFNLCVTAVAVVGIQVNIVPMMIDQGIASHQAASLLTVFGLMSLLGRVLGGLLLDRFHAPHVCAVVIACPVVGMFLLNGSFVGAIVGTALIGIAFGVETDLLPFFISRYLGMRRFGALFGLLQAAILLTSAFGPLAVNLGYELLGSYGAVMPFVAGALVLCALLILRLGPYRYPAVAGFDDSAAREESAEAVRLPGPAGATPGSPSATRTAPLLDPVDARPALGRPDRTAPTRKLPPSRGEDGHGTHGTD
ncbi:MFS transporter [Streptomyces uncialis]|uniref:MFS transporter n=1 Tax=Streptomyces uncialis TaxID=1048205 RepID=UPI003657BB86